MVVDGDDLVGALDQGALDGEQPDRTATPDRHRVTRLDLAVLGRHPAGGQDVGQEQNLLVLQAIGNDDRPDIAIGHPDILGLAAGIAAGHVRIAEQTRHRRAVGDFA